MILNAAHLNKSFGNISILRDASFLVEEHDKIAVVGQNGAGKTTLLNILSGEDSEYTGTIGLSKGYSIGYLHQLHNLDSTLTIEEELMKVIEPIIAMENELEELHQLIEHADESALPELYEKYNALTHKYELNDGYSARSRVYGIINGLGFTHDDYCKPIQNLSGGQKTRVSLGKLLLESPDIIMLDEPTNHLDLTGIEWLEGYLRGYKGAVIIVSHDRYFMDKTANKVIEIENAHVRTYTGNYSDYAIKKEAVREALIKAYENQQRNIQHQEAVINKLKSFNREKSIKRAESREKMLDKIERIDRPTDIASDMKLSFTEDKISGQDVLMVSDMTKGFDGNELFEHISFEIKRGEHVAIIGDNGTGKTTILKLLTGILHPDSGDIRFGTGVMIAYYDQEQQVLDDNKTIFEELQDAYPSMDNTAIRNVLAAFLYTGDDVFKMISDLSGGERGRVSLAKLMLSGANLILLDEPTNHLDMSSKEILESAIRKYSGTVLYVSHDRYFINMTASRILHLSGNHLYNFIGNYDYFIEKKDIIESQDSQAAYMDQTTTKSLKQSSAADSWKAEKERVARQKKAQKELDDCESSIESLEEQKSKIEQSFEDTEVQCDVGKLCELQKKLDDIEKQLGLLYHRWEELTDAIQ